MLGLSSACASASQRLAEQLAPPVVMPPATNKVPTALLWLRRDLRVADNPALVAALQGAFRVVRHHLLACAATPCVVLAASVLDRPLEQLSPKGDFLRPWSRHSPGTSARQLGSDAAARRVGARLHMGAGGGGPVPAGALLPVVAAEQPPGAGGGPARAGVQPHLPLRAGEPHRAAAAGAGGRRPGGPSLPNCVSSCYNGDLLSAQNRSRARCSAELLDMRPDAETSRRKSGSAVCIILLWSWCSVLLDLSAHGSLQSRCAACCLCAAGACLQALSRLKMNMSLSFRFLFCNTMTQEVPRRAGAVLQPSVRPDQHGAGQ